MPPGRKRSIVRDKAGNARQTLMTRGPASIRKFRRVPEKESWTKSASHLVGKADSVMIEDYTNESIFLKNLQDRYDSDVIYTYIRGVCISVNPYQDLDMYTGGLIDEYYGTQLYEVPPHLYAIANQAYYSMKEENTDQCVLISGESGAGKTEAAKQILQFLASTSTNTGLSSQIRDKLLMSNPILEAFGNAKTLRNDNSSRFGKYMEVQFDFKGEPIGGKIINYLLEKSRVVRQMDGERNFHMFYMLLADAIVAGDREIAGSGDDFYYTKQGSISKVDTLDDLQEMHNMTEAMSSLGMTSDEQKQLLDLVAFILQLGEVEFEGADTASVKNRPVLAAIEKLVGVPADIMAASLTNNTIVARGETVSSPLKPEQAAYARDALGKSVYFRAFDWLVERLNKAFVSDGSTAGRSTVMGLLDIYGFEILAKNGFEQICINYCNEKLQQLFIELTLKTEQAEYEREGIEWVPVEYFDNHVLCEMIESEKKPFGLISVLNDCSIAPGDPKDADFLSAMDSAFGQTQYYSSFAADKALGRTQFVVKHYAGDVAYTIDGFLDANNDLLYRDLKVAMLSATNIVINATFDKAQLESMKRPATAGTQFRKNMNDLMDILMAKTPSYVRCIKPNGEKKANTWDEASVQHQVKYLGLMESLRVARAGYCYRRPFDHFLERYKSLCPDTWPNFFGDDAGGVAALAAYLSAPQQAQEDTSPWVKPSFNLGLEKGEIAIGNTKVFIRSPQSVTAIEQAFQKHKHWIATRIAAAWRGYAQRKKYLKLKAAAIAAQKYARVVLANNWAKKRKAAVDQVRKFIKGFIHRKDPVSPVNEMFVTFARKAWLKQLIVHLPATVLSTSWIGDSKTPAALTEVSGMLKTLAHSNNCRKYRLGLSAERRSMLSHKLLAETLFRGKKANYRASVGVPFTMNRIEDDVLEGAKAAFAKVKTPEESIMYSTLLHKFDRSTYKHKRDDVVIVTQTFCRVFGDAPKFKEKMALPLSELNMISTSDMSDGVIVISTPGIKGPDGIKGDKGDFIFDTPHVIEFATYIIMSLSVRPGPESPAGEQFHGVRDNVTDKLTIGSELSPMLKGQKPGKVLFAVGEPDYQIVKDGSGKALKVIAPETKTADAFAGRVRNSVRMRAK